MASSAPVSPPRGARSTERCRASASALPDVAEATGFTGFDPTAVALLADLPDWDADQYSAAKEQLGTGLRKPGLALIEYVARRIDSVTAGSQAASASRRPPATDGAQPLAATTAQRSTQRSGDWRGLTRSTSLATK